MNAALNEILTESEKLLKNESNSASGTGNQPRFPMIIMCDNLCQKNTFYNIEKFLKRIWPQTTQYIPMYQYNFDSSQISFKDYRNDFSEVEKSLDQIIDMVQSEKDAFGDFHRLRVYNIIETKSIKDIRDFDILYKASCAFSSKEDLLLETMLIVLLDDSNEKRQTANEIRDYLSKNNTYNSTIIISNRTFGNRIERGEEWYRIVADVILLSTNDTVFSYDDQDVRKRSDLLFGCNSTFTVSYKLFEKPIKEIAKQMVKIILFKALEYINEKNQLSNKELMDKLGFEKSDNLICSKYFSDNPIVFDETPFVYLPLKQIPNAKNDDLSKMSYQEYCTYYYEEVFEETIHQIFQNEIKASTNIGSYINEFKDYLCEKITINDIKTMDENTVNSIFSTDSLKKPNYELKIPEYYEEYVKNYIKKEYLYPQFKIAIGQLKNQAKEIEKYIAELNEDMLECVIADNSVLGTVYKTTTEDYYKSTLGRSAQNKILNLKNSKERIISEMLSVFKSILNENEELFSLSFVDEWQRRLNLTGENIYHQIGNALTKEADDNIRLHGHFRPEHTLKMYLLNLGTPDKNQKTKIYEFLEKTFENDNTVQYFNTGYDDSIEGLTFVPLKSQEIM